MFAVFKILVHFNLVMFVVFKILVKDISSNLNKVSITLVLLVLNISYFLKKKFFKFYKFVLKKLIK